MGVVEKISVATMFFLAFIEITRIDLGVFADVLDLYAFALAVLLIDPTEKIFGRKSFVLSGNFLFFTTLTYFYIVINEYFSQISYSSKNSQIMMSYLVYFTLLFIFSTILLLLTSRAVLKTSLFEDSVNFYLFTFRIFCGKQGDKKAIRDVIMRSLRYSRRILFLGYFMGLMGYILLFLAGITTLSVTNIIFMPLSLIEFPSNLFLVSIYLGRLLYSKLRKRKADSSEEIVLPIDEEFATKTFGLSFNNILLVVSLTLLGAIIVVPMIYLDILGYTFMRDRLAIAFYYSRYIYVNALATIIFMLSLLYISTLI